VKYDQSKWQNFDKYEYSDNIKAGMKNFAAIKSRKDNKETEKYTGK
jgi:hypothetical protein